MPVYDYLCEKCQRITHDVRCIADRREAPACYFCSSQTKLITSPVAGVVKNPAVPRKQK